MRLVSLLFVTALAKPAFAEAPSVITDIAPIHGLVSSVMEGVESPKLLLQPGVDPHSYSLRPSEARALAEADIVFWIGPELTPWLSKSINNLASNATVISLLHEVEDKTLEFRGEGHDDHADEHDDHDDEHDDHADKHDDHDDEHDDHAEKHDDHDDHDDGHKEAHGDDPHAWLDPQIALIWLDQIKGRLSETDPENADTYAKNAQAAKERISTLAQEIEVQFSDLSSNAYFASHDSYQYFERQFDLSMAGSIALSDAKKPGPKRLLEMQKRAQEGKATCLVVDAIMSRDLIRTVVEGTDLSPTSVDPLGFDIPPGPAFYPTFIKSVADAFVSCLKGDT